MDVHPWEKLHKQTVLATVWELPTKFFFFCFFFAKGILISFVLAHLWQHALKLDAVISLLLVLFLTLSSGIDWLLTSFTLLQCFYSSCHYAAMPIWDVCIIFSTDCLHWIFIQVIFKRLWINPYVKLIMSFFLLVSWGTLINCAF